jgi:hypothetical protein
MRTDAFEQAVGSGRAPALTFLRDRAHYVRDAVAAFPSITPCATATLITGEPPDRHGIPGQCWYDREDQRIVNYGQGPRLAFVERAREVATDLFVNLNARHLRKDVTTLHEDLADLGLVTASTNFLVYRGRHPQDVEPSVWESLFIDEGRAEQAILGPKEHYFADVVAGPSASCQDHLGVRGKVKRIKAADEWAACVARELLEKEAADMILFYLHENDHHSHHRGPKVQFENLVRAGELIGDVLGALGSWERTLDEVGVVLTADHGQSPVIKDDDHFVDLDDVLADFDVVEPQRENPDTLEGHDLVQCGNGRAGSVYLADDRREALLGPVAKTLNAHPSIDQVLWRDDGWRVVESDRGTLRFRPREGPGVADERGNRWELEGDLEAVGGVLEGKGLRTPEYPLALLRIHHALGLNRLGDVACTARLTHEIANIIDTDHKGEHGSLHAQDSLVPFLSTVAPPPLHPTTADVAPHILDHFRRVSD